MNKQEHWEEVWRKKASTEVSWYQLDPTSSLELILSYGLASEAKIIDVGGGASLLVDQLLAKGFTQLTVLDISGTALRQAQARLGELANRVRWWEADITAIDLVEQFDLWHDRAVFHFLVEREPREKYLQALKQGLKNGGYLVLATFALAGPPRCSGLEVRRYSPESLQEELGDDFKLLTSTQEDHFTPQRVVQKFIYTLWQKC